MDTFLKPTQFKNSNLDSFIDIKYKLKVLLQASILNIDLAAKQLAGTFLTPSYPSHNIEPLTEPDLSQILLSAHDDWLSNRPWRKARPRKTFPSLFLKLPKKRSSLLPGKVLHTQRYLRAISLYTCSEQTLSKRKKGPQAPPKSGTLKLPICQAQ